MGLLYIFCILFFILCFVVYDFLLLVDFYSYSKCFFMLSFVGSFVVFWFFMYIFLNVLWYFMYFFVGIFLNFFFFVVVNIIFYLFLFCFVVMCVFFGIVFFFVVECFWVVFFVF